MTTMRIECACDTCRANATHLGASFPLRADVQTGAVERLAGKSGRLGKGSTHALVELANHPVLSRAASIRANGPWAV